MKKQVKTLLLSLGSLGVVAAGSIGAVVGYGQLSEAARGWKLKDKEGNTDFRLGDQYSSEYEYSFMDTTSEVDRTIGTYIPPKHSGNNNDYGIVKGIDGSTMPVNDFIKKFQNENGSQYPLFKIRTSYFSFDNRYLAAVSADDWSKFVKWYVGDSSTPGHLSYGPEAGIISTFQIIPGVEEKGGGAVTLGGYAMKNKEKGTITFYPDAFFGTSKVFSIYSGEFQNRLADYLFESNYKRTEDYTIQQVRELLDLINKVNQKHDENNEHDYGTWGENAPHPIALEPTRIVIDENGHSEQRFKILGDFFTAGTDEDSTNYNEGHRSLLEIVSDKFPEILTASDGFYIDRDKTTGTYSIKNGPNKHFTATTRIGLPQILAAANPDFKGFGIDFLKYVSIHEYGHHETLINAADFSEGGVIASSIHPRQSAAVDSLLDIDVINQYLQARSAGLHLENVDPFGNPFSSPEDAARAHSPYARFTIDGKLESEEHITGFVPNSGGVLVPNPNNGQVHRAFQNSLDDLIDKYVSSPSGTTVYNAFLMNSFDNISGTLNPGFTMGPTDKTDVTYSLGLSHDANLLNNFINNYFYTFVLDENGQPILKANGHPQSTGVDWTPKDYYDAFNTRVNVPAIGPSDKNKTGIKRGPITDGNLIDYAMYVWFMNPGRDTWHQSKSAVSDAKALIDMLKKIETAASSSSIDDALKDNGIIIITPPPKPHSGIERFYDYEGKKWISFSEMLLNLRDHDHTASNGLGKPILTAPPVGATNVDIDLEKLGFSPPTTGTSDQKRTKFNLIDINNIKDENGISYVEHVEPRFNNLVDWLKNGEDLKKQIATLLIGSATGTDGHISLEEYAKKDYIDNILKPIITNLLGINWDNPGSSGQNSGYATQKTPRPIETDLIFSDYTYQFPEVMTRDFVQITLGQDKEGLENTNPFLGFSQSTTSFEYYVDKSLTESYDPTDQSTHITTKELAGWKNAPYVKNLDGLTDFQKNIWATITTAEEGKWLIMDDFKISKNDYLHVTKTSSNGFERDRQLRTILGWELYNTDGSPKAIESSDKITIKGPRGETPHSRAEAYWFFLLRMRGIGDRTVTGIFRDQDVDKVYTYGYMDVADGKPAATEKPKYLAFRNQQTGEVIYKEIYYQDQDTLFYLTHQGDSSARHNLGDEHYIAWSTNRFTAGQYVNEHLTEGTYDVYFANRDHSKSAVPFTMGSRNWIAENGKYHSQAPTTFHRRVDGSVEYIVETRFNGG